ncbi:unnamed protein product [Moneuplotes crassus]|uniref:Uncharacterized protein n=1 Tax=Euplotes crassus TaxID=5936 RepID=A0AAD2D7X1_EUPCR|nr:unnamed protein product [Moneuplotes crassus]
MFQQNIFFTLKGRSSYATVPGALVSLLAVIVLAAYGGALMLRMVKRREVNWSTNSYFNDLKSDDSMLELDDNHPKIMLNYRFEEPDSFPKEIDLSGYSQYVKRSHDNYKFSGKYFSHGTPVLEKTERNDDIGENIISQFQTRRTGLLKFVRVSRGRPNFKDPCSDYSRNTTQIFLIFRPKIFKGYLQFYDCREEFDSDLISRGTYRSDVKYICPKFTGFQYSGNELNSKSHYLSILFINPCKSGCVSLSTTEWEEMFKTSRLNVFVKNKYVDLNDIDNPFKSRTTNYKFYNTSEGGLVAYFNLIKHEVILEDSYWPTWRIWTEPNPIVFYTLELHQESALHRKEFKIVIETGDEVRQYRRKFLSFLEVTGTIGGIFELIEIIFGFAIGIYSSYMFKRDLTKYLNQASHDVEQIEGVLQEGNQEDSKIKEKSNRLKPDEELKELEFKGNCIDEESKINDSSNLMIAQLNSFQNKNPCKNNIEMKQKEPSASKHKSIHEKLMPFESEKFLDYDSFKSNLDCVQIIKDIKVLQQKVAFLIETSPVLNDQATLTHAKKTQKNSEANRAGVSNKGGANINKNYTMATKTQGRDPKRSRVFPFSDSKTCSSKSICKPRLFKSPSKFKSRILNYKAEDSQEEEPKSDSIDASKSFDYL